MYPRAGHARRRRNRDEFNRRAVHLLFADSLSKQTLNEIGVGRQPVHPLPPSELPVRLQDTVTAKIEKSVGFRIKLQETGVQGDHEGEEQGEQDRRDFCTGGHRSNSLSNEVQRAIRSPQENIKRTKPNVV